MKNLRVYLLLAIIALVSSCKNYLDIKPYGQTIPKTAEEFAALLHNHLNEIDYGSDEYILGNCVKVLNYDCLTDNQDASLTSYPKGNGLLLYPLAHVNEVSCYRDLYKIIRDCNIVIGNMEGRDSEEGKEVLATAHTLRAVCYYNLVRQYCDPYVPALAEKALGLSLVTEFNIEEKAIRSGLKKTVNQIVEDLNTAIRFNQKKEIYRYTVDVAKAYLARICFWTQDWEGVILPAKELLEAYPLVEGQEYIDMIQDRYGRKSNVYIRSYIYPGNADMTYSSTKELVQARPVSKSFVDLFTEKEEDIRYGLSFNRERKVTKNICARIRSAEMCLMLAESYVHTGDESNALKYLNLLRSMRITPYTPYTLENLPEVTENLIKTDATGKPLSKLMSAILCERQKELFMEGDRWFELKRNGRPEFWVTNNGLKYVTEKYMYTSPIPISETILVPGMIQNEGYEY